MEYADTVIAGAGSAGAVLAARLTEDPSHQVILVEAGPDYPTAAALPPDLANGKRNAMTHHDWGLWHVPTRQQRFKFPFPRGRVVGGSSAVNTCIALRGQPGDYDEWASLGLKSWGYTQCLPYFKRLEHDLDVDNRWHGQTGPLPIRRHTNAELMPWQAAFLEACDRLGYPSAYDSNDPTTSGCGPHAMNKIDNRRVSAAEAWLTPEVRARPNLTIAAERLVDRVVFERGRAVGVVVARGKKVRESLHAGRVVLCAGALMTPGILLRSGVGPEAELARLGVPVIHHLPGVGARLLDHPGVAILLRPTWRGASRLGPLIQTVCRYTSGRSSIDNDMILQPGSNLPSRRINLPLVTIMSPIGKPRGMGTLTWPSADVYAKPVLDNAFLEDDHDRALAVDAMSRAYALTETPPMKALAFHFWPGPRVLKSHQKIDVWIRKSCDSGYHPSGTVKMGKEGDPEAATDERGAVLGVENLYVVDASLLPTIPTANIHLTVLMMAERISDWLRGQGTSA